MDQIDYACGIDCPEGLDDEQMLMQFVIAGDCEMCYLDTYLRETFSLERSRQNQESYS